MSAPRKTIRPATATPNQEEQMRLEKAPTPQTVGELSTYIESLITRRHDYGTCVYAMSLAATAAFNHVASKLGVTGFQASCADLDILRRTRGMECPFIILKAQDMLYPQYDLVSRLKEAMKEWEPWASAEAKKLLKQPNPFVSPAVHERWLELAAIVPVARGKKKAMAK